ncbi:MAG: hypothetical protein GPJ54_07310 [Candidatus Heimdallarchaeota archaeon]|nr:hypothetical protein [Candidatus Heimdallarchaeota archaeon]
MNSNLQQDYFRKISISIDPQSVYLALTENIGNWWVKPEGEAKNVGDTPIFRFGQTHWKMKVVDLIPNEMVLWECIEASHYDENLELDGKEEWLGTKLEWKLEQNNAGETDITFIHHGLNSTLLCFEICENGWDYYFVNMLREYLLPNK